MGDFKCDICSKSYPLKGNRDRHMQSHQVAAYSCKQCDQTFKRSDYLKMHKRNCKGGLWCPMCQKSFSRKDNLKRHQKLCTKSENILKHTHDKSDTGEKIEKLNNQYLKKMELGKEVYDYLIKNTHIREGCLTEDLSSALDLYKKKQIHV